MLRLMWRELETDCISTAPVLDPTCDDCTRKKTDLAAAVIGTGRFRIRAVCEALQVSRSNQNIKLQSPRLSPSVCIKHADGPIVEAIKTIVDSRGTYGYRRVTAVINRGRQDTLNPKRIYRIMKQNHLLLERYTGRSKRAHTGRVVTLKSNTRWCSDAFTIQCWNGERVCVAFSLDTCDREAMRYIATTRGMDAQSICDLMVETKEYRFGKSELPHKIQWLSDNGPCYTAHKTQLIGRALGFDMCTTPAYSPESNGMAEAFVKTFKRDYVWLADLSSAALVLAKLPVWFEQYNNDAPHKALKMASPREFLGVKSFAASGPI